MWCVCARARVRVCMCACACGVCVCECVCEARARVCGGNGLYGQDFTHYYYYCLLCSDKMRFDMIQPFRLTAWVLKNQMCVCVCVDS